MADDQETFDYIVTGAGSAGCCVAARLSESGRYRVLLLEAGVKDTNPWIHVPLGYQKLYANPAVNWMFESEPVAGLGNRTSYQPRGKTLGGTSSINGMIYMRGTAADYDGWRQRGCEGWSYESVLPYFRKAEDNVRGASEFHGAGGPLKVSDYGDPVLAHWNYGLGRSAAFTSDAKTRWGADWVSWPNFGKFWAQVVRSVMSTGTTSILQQTADIRIDKGEVEVAIDTRDREGYFRDEVKPEVALVDASGQARRLPTEHAAPGLYRARFPIETYGDFVRMRVESRLNDQLVGLKNYAVVESYAPEYRAASADRAFLDHVAKTTKGNTAAAADQAFVFDGEPARGLRDLWRLCALLAALLLPLDIALRRLG